MPSRVSLGDFELLVLAAVVRLGDQAYGSAVFRALEETGRRVSLGAVYTTLYRLRDRGLLRSNVGEPGPEGGRRRRFFHLEPAGREALQESVDALAGLLAGTEFSLA